MLARAVYSNDLNLIKYLIEEQGLIVDKDSLEALNIFIRNNNYDIMQYLLPIYKKALDPSDFNDLIIRFLRKMMLQQYNDYDLTDYTAHFKLLMSYDVDYNKIFKSEIIKLIREGKLQNLKFYINLGADIHYDNDYMFKIAQRSNRREILDYLNSIDQSFSPARHTYSLPSAKPISMDKAIAEQNITEINKLLENGADINLAVEIAVKTGNYPMVKYLFEGNYNADIHYNNDIYLKIAADKGALVTIYNNNEYLNILQYLIAKGADMNKYKEEILLMMVNLDKLDSVKFIVGLGVDLEQALLLAIKNNNLEMVRYLLSEGAEPDEGLLEAVAANNINIVMILLNNGADVDYKDGQALKIARANNNRNMIRILEFVSQ